MLFLHALAASRQGKTQQKCGPESHAHVPATSNARVFPGIDPVPVRLGDRVRVRIGNLTMTNHPIHPHGFSFAVTGTDGGWIPESARWPETTTDVPVGAIRAIEADADAPGDWTFHCHKSHHTMNAMGHNTHNMIGNIL